MISRPRTPVADYRAMRVTARSRGVEVGMDLATMYHAHRHNVPLSGVRQRDESRSVVMVVPVAHLSLGETTRRV